MGEICPLFEHRREGSREGRVGKIKNGKKKNRGKNWMGKNSRGGGRLLKRDLNKRKNTSLLQKRKTSTKEDTLGSSREQGMVISGHQQNSRTDL